MNYIHYMLTPFTPILSTDGVKVEVKEPVLTIVHPLSQTKGYLAWAANKTNPNVEDYEKFLQQSSKERPMFSQGKETTEEEKRASLLKLELYELLQKEAADRKKAAEVVVEGLNYVSPSYWANKYGASLNGTESFLFDVAADPTTYLSMGVLPVAKLVGKKATKEAIEKATKEAVEKTVKENIEKSTREVAEKATSAGSSKNVADIQKAIAFAKAMPGYMLSPGGAWYERQLANGVLREKVDQLAAIYKRNLRAIRPVEIMPLAGAEGTTTVKLASDPDLFLPTTTIRISPYAQDAKGTMLHELSHAMTHNAEVRAPKNLHYFYKSVLKDPELFDAIRHNQDMLPLANASERTIPINRFYKETLLEIRARAFAVEADAAVKGVDIDTYLDTPKMHGQLLKELLRLYDKEAVRNFIKNYKAIVPIVGTVGATGSALQADNNVDLSLKQERGINYINYSK